MHEGDGLGQDLTLVGTDELIHELKRRHDQVIICLSRVLETKTENCELQVELKGGHMTVLGMATSLFMRLAAYENGAPESDEDPGDDPEDGGDAQELRKS